MFGLRKRILGSRASVLVSALDIVHTGKSSQYQCVIAALAPDSSDLSSEVRIALRSLGPSSSGRASLRLPARPRSRIVRGTMTGRLGDSPAPHPVALASCRAGPRGRHDALCEGLVVSTVPLAELPDFARSSRRSRENCRMVSSIKNRSDPSASSRRLTRLPFTSAPSPSSTSRSSPPQTVFCGVQRPPAREDRQSREQSTLVGFEHSWLHRIAPSSVR